MKIKTKDLVSHLHEAKGKDLVEQINSYKRKGRLRRKK